MATKSKTNYDKVDSGQTAHETGYCASIRSCMNCITSCPGKCSHFTYHTGEEGNTFFCLLSAGLWCQLTTFLVSLWVLSGLFWWLMFYFASTWPTTSMYVFLGSCVAFMALFGILMAVNQEEDDDRQRMGCTMEELKAHITPQFSEGMDWDNFGDFWHVVHKASIYEENPNASPQERLKDTCILLHYTNTVPCLTSNLSRQSLPRHSVPKSVPVTSAGHLEEKTEGSTAVTIHQ